MEREDTTTTVTLLGVLPGDPPRILTGERLYRDGQPGRLFQQMIPVPDTELFSRLTAQVNKGDAVTVTVTTEWYADGYKTYLSDFALSDRKAQRGNIYFTEAQCCRMQELLARRETLTAEERTELEALVDAALEATVARTDHLVRQNQP
jgi:hypothetical protein